MVYNPISCSGWERAGAGYLDIGGACMKSKLGFVILFFVIALLRKWGGEEVGMPFSFLFSLVLGLGGYGLMIVIFGSFKLAMLIGLIGAAVGGYGGGIFFGDEGGSY